MGDLISRRKMMAISGSFGLVAALPGGEKAAPSTERRKLFLDAGQPAAIWADIARADDIEAMRALAAAVMADVHRKKSWSLAWRVATRFAYRVIYKPFGLYIGESDHLAHLVGADIVSPSDMAALQRLYTLAHAGCTTVLAWDEDRQRMVHFRSLDWPSAAAIAGATRIFTGQRADGSTAFSAAGILGMVGLLTAVKPGFSVAINFAPWTGTSFSANPDPTFLVRRLMSSAVGTYDQARRAIETWHPGAPVFVSLCGIARGEGCVYEFGAAWDKKAAWHAIPLGTRDALVQTNHFDPNGPFARHQRPQAPPMAWDDPAWDDHPILATSVARRTLLEQALQNADLERVLYETYSRRPLWNPETAQWVMMVPQTGEIRVWARTA